MHNFLRGLVCLIFITNVRVGRPKFETGESERCYITVLSFIFANQGELSITINTDQKPVRNVSTDSILAYANSLLINIKKEQ